MSYLVEKILKEFAESDFKLPVETIEQIKSTYNIKKELGSGTHGIAWLDSQNQVLKLTNDIGEAAVAKKLAKKNYSFCANVYWVMKIKNCFLIYQEFLKPLTPKEKEAVNICYYLTDYLAPAGVFYNRYKGNDLEKISALIAENDFDVQLTRDLTDFNDNEYIVSLFKQYLVLFQQVNKYKFQDLHSLNIGWKQNGSLAAFDLRI